MEPKSAKNSASGTLRRGLSVSPAATGTYSKPVQANSAAKPPTLSASRCVEPEGGGTSRRRQPTKKRPAPTQSQDGAGFGPLNKALASAPGLTARYWSLAGGG